MAGVLLPAGAYCVIKARNHGRQYVPLALIPLIFGVQQFGEGWVWLGMDRTDTELVRDASLYFLFFALFVWPMWVPLSVMLTERRPTRKRWFAAAALLGAVSGAALFIPLAVEPAWLSTEVARHSIYYNMDRLPVFDYVPRLLLQMIYLGLVSAPLLASSDRRLIKFGAAVLLSAVVSQIFFAPAFASIWCFLAAALSVYLCVLFRRPPVLVDPGATVSGNTAPSRSGIGT